MSASVTAEQEGWLHTWAGMSLRASTPCAVIHIKISVVPAVVEGDHESAVKRGRVEPGWARSTFRAERIRGRIRG